MAWRRSVVVAAAGSAGGRGFGSISLPEGANCLASVTHHSSRLVILPSGRKEDRLGYPTWFIVYHILLESPVVSVCSRRLCIGRNLPITILCLFSWGRPGSYSSFEQKREQRRGKR